MTLLVPAALALVVWVAWSPLVRSPFLFDDHAVIEKDAWIKERGGELQTAAGNDVGGLETAAPVWRGLWRLPRPMRALTHRVDSVLFGPKDASGPHTVNLVLHWLCAVLWFALLRRIGRGEEESAAAAALFAALPVCAEALGVVSHRKEMLALAPMLGALNLALAGEAQNRKAGGARERKCGVSWRMILPVALFALAVAGKETALVLPALAAACILERARRRSRQRGVGWVNALVLAVSCLALFVAARWQVNASMEALPGGMGAPGLGARPGHLPNGTSLSQAAAWAAWALPRYAAHVFSPIGHCLDPALPDGGPCSSAVVLGCAFAAAWIAAAAIGFRRRSEVDFPLAWCALAISPAVFPPLLASGGLAVLADHYAYAAAPGAALLVVSAARIVLKFCSARVFIFGVALAVYVVFARYAARDYQTEDSLWNAVLRSNPRSYLAHHNLAFSAWKRGCDPKSARIHFARMAEIRPDFVQGLQAYVNFMSERDGSRAALRWLGARMDAADSPFPRAALAKMRGALRSAGGDFAGAEADLRFALADGADDSAVRHNLGVALQRQMRWKEAAEQFAVSKDDPRLPDDAALADALGGAWRRRPIPKSGVSRVLVVGDSVPAGYDAACPEKSRSLAQRLNEQAGHKRRSGDRLPPAAGRMGGAYRFSNRAVPGSTLHSLPEKLPVLLQPDEVRFCIVMSGHNDAFAGTPPAILMRDMADCILICRLLGVEPVVLGPIPVRTVGERDRAAQERTLAAWNGMLGDFCRENEVRFLDVRKVLGKVPGTNGIRSRLLDSATGNHLTDLGMARLAEAVVTLFGGDSL